MNLGIKEVPGRKVLVIGGGNAAVDVGITALRLGAKEVTLACLECREEMPALPWEIEQAVEEGVQLMPSWGPRRVLESGGKIRGMELVRCTSVFDTEGRFAPTFDNAAKEIVEADQIFMAIGYTADISFVDPKWRLNAERGLIGADPETQATGIPGVFAGGSITHGPATVIEAIASGRRAAIAINLYLKGASVQAEENDEKAISPLLKFDNEYLKRTSRVKTPKLPLSERRINVEDTLGVGFSEIEKEARRCFNCGCVAVNSSDIAVALLALDATVEIVGPRGIRTIPIEEFFVSSRNSLGADEMLTEIRIPKLSDRAKQTFLKFRLRRAIDFAIVSVASVITIGGGICENAAIALGGVAPRPVRATKAEETIKGKPISSAIAEAASEAAMTDVVPLNMNKYKVEITKTLVKRAILS